MDNNPPIWIEIGQAGKTSIGQVNSESTDLPKGGYHALFAARVLLKSFEELVGLKWGFSQESLWKEAKDRQQLFTETHHYAEDAGIMEPPDRRTLALRTIHKPGRPNLQIIVLGKIYATNAQEARTRAMEYWHEVSSQFPYDYTLIPIQDQMGFANISKYCSYKNNENPVGACVEISRFEGVLQSEKTFLDVIGSWNSTLASNEKIWRVLASCPSEVMLNITLRPTVLYDDELLALAQIIETAKTVACESKNPLTRQDAELIQQIYLERQKNMGYAYLAQLHVVSPDVIPEYIPRAIGSALTHRKQDQSRQLGYQMRRPQNKGELIHWLKAIYWLEPYATPGIIKDARLQRLRYLVNTMEAGTLFQLPFPPKGGIFGVNFEKQPD